MNQTHSKLVRILLILCASASVSAAGSATTLVGIWTERKVTIAADSKQTLLSPAGEVVGSQNVCKIYEADGMVFAFAGLAKSEAIDVVESVRNQHPLTETGTGKNLPVETLIVGADAALFKILQARQRSSDQSLSVAMLIAGEIDGKLQMIRVENFGFQASGQFMGAQGSRRIVYPESRGYGGTDPNRGIEILGFDNAIKRFKASSPDWSRGNNADLARNFITLESQDPQDSKYVGVPISEVVITKRGAKWVHKGACQVGPVRGLP